MRLISQVPGSDTNMMLMVVFIIHCRSFFFMLCRDTFNSLPVEDWGNLEHTVPSKLSRRLVEEVQTPVREKLLFRPRLWSCMLHVLMQLFLFYWSLCVCTSSQSKQTIYFKNVMFIIFLFQRGSLGSFQVPLLKTVKISPQVTDNSSLLISWEKVVWLFTMEMEEHSYHFTALHFQQISLLVFPKQSKLYGCIWFNDDELSSTFHLWYWWSLFKKMDIEETIY